MWFVIPYYHKICIFTILERWLIYDSETECSFVSLITNHSILRVDLYISIATYVWFASAYQISSKSVDARRSYDVIFEDGGHRVGKLFPVAGLVTELIWEGQNLSAYQISMRYLNPRPGYYYFRFRKTKRRHIGILLPVCNLIIYATLACCPL